MSNCLIRFSAKMVHCRLLFALVLCGAKYISGWCSPGDAEIVATADAEMRNAINPQGHIDLSTVAFVR